jgi:hypothetical protein
VVSRSKNAGRAVPVWLLIMYLINKLGCILLSPKEIFFILVPVIATGARISVLTQRRQLSHGKYKVNLNERKRFGQKTPPEKL